MLITTVPFLGHTTTSKELFFKLLLLCINNQSINHIHKLHNISHNDFTPQRFHTSMISHLNDFTPKVESPTQLFHTYRWVTRIDQVSHVSIRHLLSFHTYRLVIQSDVPKLEYIILLCATIILTLNVMQIWLVYASQLLYTYLTLLQKPSDRIDLNMKCNVPRPQNTSEIGHKIL